MKSTGVKIMEWFVGGFIVLILIALLISAMAGVLAFVVDSLLTWGFPDMYKFTFIQTYVTCFIVVIVSGFFSSSGSSKK